MERVEMFGFAGSTYVRTARMVCEEKGVGYQLQPLEFRAASHRALHPFLRMPIVRIGKTVLYETLAITSYIDETFDGPRLTPDEPLARARMLQWIGVCSDYLYTGLVRALLKSDDASDETVAAARRDLEVVNGQFEAQPFLLGDRMYLCDLFLAPVIAFAGSHRVGPPLFRGLEGIAAWRERIGSRASFAATQP